VRWQSVDVQPFEQVVTEHGAVVFRVCRAVLADHGAAEDAWSETFVAALRAYPDLRPESDVRAWLVTIAHRKAIDQVRRQARGSVPMAAVPERSVAAAHEPDDDLLAAVAALPAKQRAAVAYRYLADLSYADIAALLGSSQAAARRSAADGIAALRTTGGLRR
jgi:RNA polymerase sigma factor (sigma-70 family)